MKMKEVCVRTGLTRKTVLFYEEQELVFPKITPLNGRNYREYEENDVQRLLDVAALRRAGFSVDEIKRMLTQPRQVQPIFTEYRQRLSRQQEELAALVRTAENIELESLLDVDSLLRELRAVSEPLPLPPSDCQPHFAHIDAMETELYPEEESKYHRDAVPVQIDQDHIFVDKTMGYKRMLDDVKTDLQERPRTIVPEPPAGPFWLRFIKGLSIFGIVIFAMDMMAATRRRLFSSWFLKDFGIVAGLSLLVFLISLWQKRFRKKEKE